MGLPFCLFYSLPLFTGAPPEEKAVEFAREVWPILARSCHGCHGAEKQRSELRLDQREAALRGGLSGRVIVPGKSGESRLIRLVSGLDEKLVMPPRGKRLAVEEIGAIRAWIDQGARWPDGVGVRLEKAKADHWAFQSIVRPVPPEAMDPDWVENPIDRFVLREFEREGLEPSPEAHPAALIRRLSLDLTGLPPTPAEVDRFLAERGPRAYTDLVERLLASPRYGEKWARDWLDAARYADTNGYEKDNPRVMWRYRDWVIEALNRDLPFDRFTIEQVAGDMLPEAREGPAAEGQVPGALIATGFHRNTMFNEEGGIDDEEFRYQAMVDRVSTVGTVFLGLTLACAQCHSHKYDPISQREYFQFFALLNGADEPRIEAPTPAELAARREHRSRLASLETEICLDSSPGGEGLFRTVNEKQPAWEREARKAAHRWTVLDPQSAASEGKATLKKLPDRSLLASGIGPGSDTYRVEVETELAGITAFRLEALTHPSLPRGGPGRGRVLGEGNFVLSEFTVRAGSEPVRLRNPSADHSAKEMPIEKAIDGEVETGWSIEAHKPGMNVPRGAVFETERPVGGPGATQLTFTLVHHYVHEHNLGRFRISATTDPSPIRSSGLPAEVEEVLLVEDSRRDPAQRAALKRAYRERAPELGDLQKKLAELRKVEPPVTTALVMREREEPRTTRIHIRGEYLEEGDEVAGDVPACLPPLPEGKPWNRLTLARWLVAPGNPLTARVAVNRIWQAYFGRGLVATPEDFGIRGEPPSHPELLDWLASEFQDGGWSLKALHRLITDSATYRQSPEAPHELYRRDPQNALLARGARFRLGAEAIRDVALSVSGLLSPKIGGPSVFPPQPEGFTSLSYGRLDWKTSEGEDRHRRGLYTFWKRTSPYPAFTTFDAPMAETACVRRLVTNTPLQALTLLNDPVFAEAAQALARRVVEEGPVDDPGRVRHAFRLCVAREPDRAELEESLEFLKAQRAEKDEPFAWMLLARVLLNLDETITRG